MLQIIMNSAVNAARPEQMTRPMKQRYVTYGLEGAVALIGLDRPAKRNALSDAMIEELRAAVLRAGDEAKAAVIFGHGDHFSSGLDLAEHADRSPIESIHPSPKWPSIFEHLSRGV